MDDDLKVASKEPSIFDKMRGIEHRVGRSEIDGTLSRVQYAIDVDEMMYEANVERNRHLDRIANSLERISGLLTTPFEPNNKGS